MTQRSNDAKELNELFLAYRKLHKQAFDKCTDDFSNQHATAFIMLDIARKLDTIIEILAKRELNDWIDTQP